MEITEEKDNFLTNRKEIKIIVGAEKNPSFDEALDLICREFKADKELVVVRGIKGKFGRNTFLISSFIYKSKEDKEKFEKKKKAEIKTEEKPAAEQKPEEKKEEAKKE